MQKRSIFAPLILCLMLVAGWFAGSVGVQAQSVQAQNAAPWQAAGTILDVLFAAQSALLAGNSDAALTYIANAQAAVGQLRLPSQSQTWLDSALTGAAAAVVAHDPTALARARGQAQGAIYWGSLQRIQEAIILGDEATARSWLLVRDYRPSTRFVRPDVDATLALHQMSLKATDETLAQVNADLLDTYQARLTEHMALVLDVNKPVNRRAESAGVAQLYWHILQPAYAAQQGAAAAATRTAQFDTLALAVGQAQESEVQAIGAELQRMLGTFRAAPLSPAEQTRRAGQLMRYLALVPVEYGRGVSGDQVIAPIEIQEAVTFMMGARAALADLRLILAGIDAAQTARLEEKMVRLADHLNAANKRQLVRPPEEIAAEVAELTAGLSALLPAEWLTSNNDADFDVLMTVLDQLETAVQQGDYKLAESARLEAYAIFDFGPEPRLLAFAPEQVARIDGLFWQGSDGQRGLADAIALQADAAQIATTRVALDAALRDAQLTLGDLPSSPGAIISNAAIIVFREGLESVVILAALMASMVGAYARFRRPMMLGVLLSVLATAVTWWLAQQILFSLTRLGERLEAVVSLVAIGVLLLITNWFFHKTYWTDWMSGFHRQKRRLLTAEAGQFLGLVMLGFTSMYREGFETVLFLQALVLDAGTAVVLQGVGLGMLGVFVVGAVTFRLQAQLPYKKMLVWTGVLIGLVLVIMVGKTVHVMQAVGWMGIMPIKGLTLPYEAGLWFGLYATWQVVGWQMAAAAFVLGSYFGAEWWQNRKRRRLRSSTKQAAKR